MSIKEKRKLKIDNTPAPLQTLDEIYQEKGLPFTAMKVVDIHAGTCFTIVKRLSKDEESEMCDTCKKDTRMFQDAFETSVSVSRCGPCSTINPSGVPVWKSDTRFWVKIS